MKCYKADLHIHTIISPCASLDMTPVKIINKAIERGLNIIGITDHNSTLHCKLMFEKGLENNLLVVPGVEINTKEEIHILVYFKDFNTINDFQLFLENNLPKIENKPDLFGEQLVVDYDENIINEIPYLLLNSLNVSIDEVYRIVKRLNGLFIPAHINRPSYSILSVLGFIPESIKPDALELYKSSKYEEYQNNYINDYKLIFSSDSHNLDEIGKFFSQITLNELSLDAFFKFFN